jgi:hypothetical protein
VIIDVGFRRKEILMGWVMLVYFIGLLASVYVQLGRVGLLKVERREFVRSNLGWFLMSVGKDFIWPAVLIVWLAQGRPASRWEAVTELDGRDVRAIVRK